MPNLYRSTICTPQVLRYALLYVALVMGLAFGALFAGAASAGGLPCGIEAMRKSEDGIALKFDRKQFWHFSGTNGDIGIIGTAGVRLVAANFILTNL